jgi:glycosyltransferase involved in cell wall biosynthesis
MRILIVQPVLALYRVPIFKGISDSESVSVLKVYSDVSNEFGYVGGDEIIYVEAGWRRCLRWGYTPYSLKMFYKLLKDSTHVIHFSDFKYMTLWYGLFISFFLRKKFYLHGQGGYKGRQGFFKQFIYTFSVWISSGYICYSEYSKSNIERLIPSFLHKKLSVVSNSLYMVSENLFDIASKGLFYVGRLREGCGVELALEAAESLGITMHVVGGGEYLEQLKKKYSSASFYGAVFDLDQQKYIASRCMAGIYGGDAGLSVVHYMAWGLPVIVHSCFEMHMGPEPSYIRDKYNGLLFERENLASLKSVIHALDGDLELRKVLSSGALETFDRLSNPRMHEKFLKVLEGKD